MIYLVGSVTMRLMALTFLFPVIAKFTLAVVRPGYYETITTGPIFAFQVGLDAVLVILGVSLLFRGPAENLLGQTEARAISILRALIMSALTAAAILLSLASLQVLGVINSLAQDGVMMLALGFWTVFFTCCIFPGWYRRKLWPAEGPPALPPGPVSPVPDGARFLDLAPRSERAARGPRWRLARAPAVAHMGLSAWLVTGLTALLFALIVIGGVHGRTNAHFFPTPRYEDTVATLLWPLGVLCAGLLVAFALIGPRPDRRTALGSPFWRTVLAVAVFYFGFYLCADPALRLGLPDYHAQTHGGEARVVPAIVVARDQDYRRHGCDRTALLTMNIGQGAQDYLLCDLEPSLWNGLHRGQALNVIGTRTKYGFYYARVTAR